MPLVQEKGTTYAAFSWQAPSERLTVVVCGLFLCPPILGSEQPIEIENHDQCLLARTEFSVSEGTYDLGSPDLRLPSSASSWAPSPASPLPVSDLTVGCWAYNDIEIVAATQLLPVRPAEVNDAELMKLVAPSCLEAPELQPCELGQKGHIGACTAGLCAPRCLTDADCASLAYEKPNLPMSAAGGGAGGADVGGAAGQGGATILIGFSCQAAGTLCDFGVCVEDAP